VAAAATGDAADDRAGRTAEQRALTGALRRRIRHRQRECECKKQ
jgi:hypothetical protein